MNGSRRGPWQYLVERWPFLVITATVYGVSVAAFHHVTLSSGLQASGLTAALLGIRIFLTENDGVPASGHPFWVGTLWACYFAAPAVSVAQILAFVSLVRGAVWDPEKAAARLRDHVVIAGYGKHAEVVHDWLQEPRQAGGFFAWLRKLRQDGGFFAWLRRLHQDGGFFAWLRKLRQASRFVIIERDPARVEEMRARGGAVVVLGDMADPAVLKRAGVPLASQFFAMSGDDLANLRACRAARSLHGAVRAAAMVGDGGLAEVLARLDTEIAFLNPYAMAARELVDLGLAPAGTPVEGVVIAGFGRFGQALALELSRRDGAGRLRVVVVDRDATRRVAIFRGNHDLAGVDLRAVEGDIEDPQCIEAALAKASRGPDGAAVVLCTDQDATNFRTALLLLERRRIQASVVCRMFQPPPALGGSAGRLRAVHLFHLLEKGLEDFGLSEAGDPHGPAPAGAGQAAHWEGAEP